MRNGPIEIESIVSFIHRKINCVSFRCGKIILCIGGYRTLRISVIILKIHRQLSYDIQKNRTKNNWFLDLELQIPAPFFSLNRRETGLFVIDDWSGKSNFCVHKTCLLTSEWLGLKIIYLSIVICDNYSMPRTHIDWSHL